MSMYGNSGCFGNPYNPSQPIDNIGGVGSAVGDILNDTPENDNAQQVDLAQVQYGLGALREFVRRVNLLTYAVVALAVIVIMREIKD